MSLADREGDIYDIFVEAQHYNTPADFVIRSQRKLATHDKDPDGGPACYIKMRQEILQSEVIAIGEIQLPQSHKRSARTATLHIRARRITLKAPHAKSSLPSVTVSVVCVEEVNGPEDGTDVNWLLLSSLPLEGAEDALRIIDFYVVRWPIEVFFRVLKSGCRVEEIQLETRSRLKRALMFYEIIAWRIMFLTFIDRECPQLPCSVIFSESEWRSAWQIARKTTPPEKPPKLSEFIPVLAMLGGYNNRRHDGPPGTEVIWRRTRRMLEFALCWHAFGPEQ